MAVTSFSVTSPATLIALGAGVLGGSAIFASVAAAGRVGLTPGRRALIHWLPIACTVLLVRLMGGWEASLGIIFGTSVAIMSAALGSLSTLAPVGPAPANWKRLWPFTLAAALIVFVSGFNGLLSWKHGVALFVEGLALYSLWWDSVGLEWVDPAQHQDRDFVPAHFVWIALMFCILLAVGGAYFSQRALAETAGRARLAPGTVSATLLSVVLIAPMAQGDRRLASIGSSWIAATASFGVVLLNLCVLLPIIAIAPYLVAYYRAARISHRPIIDWSAYTPHPTVFPLAVWRIDTVAIVLLSLLVLPVAMGKWNLGRQEGIALIIAYCIYLAAVTIAGAAM